MCVFIHRVFLFFFSLRCVFLPVTTIVAVNRKIYLVVSKSTRYIYIYIQEKEKKTVKNAILHNVKNIFKEPSTLIGHENHKKKSVE